jgi:hypothetical protein
MNKFSFLRKGFLWVFVSFLILLSIDVQAQNTRVRGKITDKSTGETLPFVAIRFKGAKVGTVSDDKGNYFIEARTLADSISASCVGYMTKTIPVKRNNFQTINIEMEANTFLMSEVVVKPGENPTIALMKKVIAHKDRNNPEKIPEYSYEAYNKMQFDINNLDEKLKDRKLMKQLRFAFDYVDTSAITGKTYLPFMLIESMTDNYYQYRPKITREVIKASRIAGVDNQSVAQFTGKLALDFNIYDNYINVFDQGFVSPISDQAFFYYKFYLLDSSFIDNRWCYQVSFKPRRKQEPTFTGYMWIADTSFAVKRMQWQVAKDININFVKDVIAVNEFMQIEDSIWVPKSEYLFVDFALSDKLTGFFGRKTTTYSNYKIGTKVPVDLKKERATTTVVDGALLKNDAYWDSARHVPLTKKEAQIYTMVDSIIQLPIYKTFADIAYLITDYYFDCGKFELGPYYTTYSYNPIEGSRFRFGGRTTTKLNPKLMFEGHIAYGTGDGRFKYAAGTSYMLQSRPRTTIGLGYQKDVRQLGKSENALLEDNFLSSFLRRNPNNKLTFVTEYKVYGQKEWFNGFSNTLTVKHKQIDEGEYVPFQTTSTTNNSLIKVPSIKTGEISLNTRFAYDEVYIINEFERISMGTDYPVINLTYTQGIKGFVGGQYDYSKINFDIQDKIPINPFGYMRIKLEVGKIFGTLPFPLLELHRGNETYAFDYFAFNMMNYYEFASDQWVSAFAEHHFQGFFLNHIPLFRKLKLREVASIRGVVGNLNHKNQNEMILPSGLSEVNRPYGEASVGVENILKFIRIDAMWRLSYLDHPDIQKFGMRAMLQVIF